MIAIYFEIVFGGKGGLSKLSSTAVFGNGNLRFFIPSVVKATGNIKKITGNNFYNC